MTAVTDALRQIRDELAALVPSPAIKGWQPNGAECWMEALGNKNPADAECLQRAYDAARAALAEAEKDEGELAAALRRAENRIAASIRVPSNERDEYTVIMNRGIEASLKIIKEERAALSKHATPEHAKKG